MHDPEAVDDVDDARATGDARIGALIAGKFRVEARLGAGTSGTVYRAVQEALSRPVALKLLTDEKTGAALRFEREAKAVAKLKHDSVVAAFDYGLTDDGVPYLAMEYVDGCSLRALLDARELTVAEAMAIAEGVAGAIAHAHAAGVVHRDVKPENVMLEGGRADARSVRVVDFGLAHVAEIAGPGVSTTIAGTPAYMAPERAEPAKNTTDERMEPAADVYALGVILYEMLTGANPFRAETALKTLMRHAEGPMPLPPSAHRAEIPRSIDALALALLQKAPAVRPSADDVVARLHAAGSSSPSATPPSLSSPSPASTGAPFPSALSPSAPTASAPSLAAPARVLALAATVAAAIVLAVVVAQRPSTPTLAATPADASALDATTAPTASAPGASAATRPAAPSSAALETTTTPPSAAATGAPTTSTAELSTTVRASTTAAPSTKATSASTTAVTATATTGATATAATTTSTSTTPVTNTASTTATATTNAATSTPDGPRLAPALARRAEALRNACSAACAQELPASLQGAVDGGLASLKAWKARLEACAVTCRP